MRNVWAVCLCLGFGSAVICADTFGTGDNQFTMDFLSISGATNPTGGYGIVNNDFRIGKFEVTNSQWNKFKDSIGGTVTGNPLSAYDTDPYYTGASLPTNDISWYEAAQLVNWLNTSTGHQAAYKFTGDQGAAGYSLELWDAEDAWSEANLYRHKDAFYFLPTEDEWVKAAYWNGTNLQTYATVNDVTPTAGVYSNYAQAYGLSPWTVGTGMEEINGTYDMMGNVYEWMESPYYSGGYSSASYRGVRGGQFSLYSVSPLQSSSRSNRDPIAEASDVGFRVASIPEPCTLIFMSLGGWLLARKKRGRSVS